MTQTTRTIPPAHPISFAEKTPLERVHIALGDLTAISGRPADHLLPEFKRAGLNIRQSVTFDVPPLNALIYEACHVVAANLSAAYELAATRSTEWAATCNRDAENAQSSSMPVGMLVREYRQAARDAQHDAQEHTKAAADWGQAANYALNVAKRLGTSDARAKQLGWVTALNKR